MSCEALADKESMLRKAIGVLLVGFAVATNGAAQPLGEPASDFIGRTSTGETLRLSDYAGKVVLLDFWASWCGPCRAEMPFLVTLYDENRDAPFEILAINVDTHSENAQAFLSDLGLAIPFPLIIDPDGAIPPLYDLEGMPTTVLIDAQGRVRFQHAGFRDADKTRYRNELQTLLDEL